MVYNILVNDVVGKGVIWGWSMANTVYIVEQGDPRIMGAEYVPGGVNFSVTVPDDKEARLILTDPSGEDIVQEIPLPVDQRIGEVASVKIRTSRRINEGYYFVIGGKKVPDPYAKRILHGVSYTDNERFSWGSEKMPAIPMADLMIYKLHVRGFTMDPGSGVRNKGTFRGLVQKIPYIAEMGFNAVELMPAYEWDDSLRVRQAGIDFSEGEETGRAKKNYWGYAKDNFYFAPKQSFSFSEDSVTEMKKMIKALHDAGIECIMEFYIPETADMMLVMKALRYWKIAYHVDGFHFVGAGVRSDLIARDPILARTKLFFEYVEGSAVYGKRVPKVRTLASCNGGFQTDARRFLKGDEGTIGSFRNILVRNDGSVGCVNYIANVNGFTLADLVSYNEKHNDENGENNYDGSSENFSWNCGVEGETKKKNIINLRKKQIRNALSYVFLAQGIPLLYAGDELGNSQGGNNNAYASDDPTGWVNWSGLRRNRDLRAFVMDLIRFRKTHPILRNRFPYRGIDYKNTGCPDISFHDTRAWFTEQDPKVRSVAAMYNPRYAEGSGGTDEYLYIAYNAFWEPHTFALPVLPEGRTWQKALETARDEEKEVQIAALKNAKDMARANAEVRLHAAKARLAEAQDREMRLAEEYAVRTSTDGEPSEDKLASYRDHAKKTALAEEADSPEEKRHSTEALLRAVREAEEALLAEPAGEPLLFPDEQKFITVPARSVTVLTGTRRDRENSNG